MLTTSHFLGKDDVCSSGDAAGYYSTIHYNIKYNNNNTFHFLRNPKTKTADGKTTNTHSIIFFHFAIIFYYYNQFDLDSFHAPFLPSTMKRRTVATISGLALAHQASRTAAWSLSSSSWSSRVSLSSISSRPRSPRHPPILAMPSTDEDIDLDSLHLTPELEMMTKAFARIPDEKTRHKQLLYMASKLEEVGDEVRVPENKVPGCLSTVHVDCVLVPGEERGGDEVVRYFGDSDGLLTKGLLALLIRCVLRSGGMLECCCGFLWESSLLVVLHSLFSSSCHIGC